MSAIKELINERSLPELLRLASGKEVTDVSDFEKRREEIKVLLAEREYGKIPPKPDHMNVEVVSENAASAAGKATLRKLNLSFQMDGKEFSFPAISVVPNRRGGKIPAFIHIGFSPMTSNTFLPTEEIIDRGYAIFSFCHNDVTQDNNDFDDKCAPYLCKSRRAASAPGKIAMWAWAAMRIMDYVQTIPEIDKDNVAVVGHSRLGKTALVTGAYDERFKYVISNNSGCSGAALSRGKVGETIGVITNVFPFWFCPKYVKEAGACEKFDFDQHFLLALTVPRHLIVSSAEEDLWADPKSEFLSLASVNPVYELYGMKGLVHNDEVPVPRTFLGEGDSAYFVRHGTHFLSREDWNAFMDYIDKFVK